MRIPGVLSEVWRNVSSGTTRAVIFALVTAVVVVVFTVADVVTIHHIEADVHQFQASAADVRTISAPGQVDGVACDQLSAVPSVQAAGAVRQAPSITAAEAPGVSMTAYEVSDGMAGVVGATTTGQTGAWVESALANVLAVGPGDTLSTADGPLQVASVFDWPNDGRDPRFGFAILLPVQAAQSFDECWIRAWPIADDNDTLLRSTLIVSTDSSPFLVSQVNRNLGVNLDAHQQYEQRLTRHGMWVAPLALFLIGFIATWSRRLEHAANLHAGLDRGSFSLGVALESLVWVVAGNLLALMVDVAAIRILGMASIGPVMATCGTIAWLSLAASLLGTLVAAFFIRDKPESTAGLRRERHGAGAMGRRLP
ncbi:MAG: hypothetical protein FWF43_07715 [Propionibacteriaceae bacterium]|nr:hypothetical protein [Propionibacteriaceae bacterium]